MDTIRYVGNPEDVAAAQLSVYKMRWEGMARAIEGFKATIGTMLIPAVERLAGIIRENVAVLRCYGIEVDP